MVFNKEKFEECYKMLEDYSKKDNEPFTSTELCWLINNVKNAAELWADFINRKEERYVYLAAINEQRAVLEDNLKRIKELSGYNFRLGDFVIEEKDESKTD